MGQYKWYAIIRLLLVTNNVWVERCFRAFREKQAPSKMLQPFISRVDREYSFRLQAEVTQSPAC